MKRAWLINTNKDEGSSCEFPRCTRAGYPTLKTDSHRMKSFVLKTAIFVLLLAFPGAGCENNERDIDCFKGEVVQLNKGDGCMNMIHIIETNLNSSLETGVSISYNPNGFDKELMMGEIVYFKIKSYEKYTGYVTANCRCPEYTAIIELCNN